MRKYRIAISAEGKEMLFKNGEKSPLPDADTYECWIDGVYLHIVSGDAGYIPDPAGPNEAHDTMYMASPPNRDTMRWKLVQADEMFAEWRRQLVDGDIADEEFEFAI